MNPIHAEEVRRDDHVNEMDAREDVVELSLDDLPHVAGGAFNGWMQF
jgi:hypothetical protein